MQCCFNETEPEASQIRLTEKKITISIAWLPYPGWDFAVCPSFGSCWPCGREQASRRLMPGLLLLGARARCGSRKNGKEDRSQIGTFRSSRSRGAQTCSGAMEGNQAWTGGRLLFLMGSSNRLIGRAANAGVVGDKVGWCRLREASGRLAAWAGEVRFGPSWFMLPIGPAPSRPWAAPVRWWACRWHRPILLIAAHSWPSRAAQGREN